TRCYRDWSSDVCSSDLVNIAWALDELREDPTPERARRLHRDEVERCRRMGEHGASLVAPGTRVLTHCNAGALATGGYGSGLGPEIGRASWRDEWYRARG